MISYIKGRIIKIMPSSVIIENNGIGYEIFVTPGIKSSYNNTTELIELYTYLSVREDSWTLYGFLSWEEKELFLLLISVSGVGPKAALSVLASGSLAHLRLTIGTGNTEVLTKIPGIGKKIAQRIVVELKEKMQDFIIPDSQLQSDDTLLVDDNGVIEGLKALGYHPIEIKKVYPRLIKENPEANEATLIKKALQLLARM